MLTAPELRQPGPVQDAYAAIVASEVALITVLNAQIERLGQVVAEHFGRHRDADIYTSLPGLGVILGARILGEFGDDPHRYADAKGRKAYAGTAPSPEPPDQTGRARPVRPQPPPRRRRPAVGVLLHARLTRRPRLLPGPPARGIGHQAALRQLANRWVGILHGCLRHRTFYDENTAWQHHLNTAA